MYQEILTIGLALVSFGVWWDNKHDETKTKWILLCLNAMWLCASICTRGFLWYDIFLLFFLIFYLSGLIFSKRCLLLFKIGLIGTLIFYLGAILLFPRRSLPSPTGKYKVGTVVYTVTDTKRKEPYSNFKKKRIIKLQAWYPIATNAIHSKVPWLYDGKAVARGLAKDASLPKWILDQMTTIFSHSYNEGKLLSEQMRYPIVILSHGWRSARNLYQDIAEELASRGYIVFAIDHTYGSVATVLEGEGLKTINYKALSSSNSRTFREKSQILVDTYANDIGTTLHFLQQLNLKSSIFKNRLDMNKVGVLGHSTGGGGCVQYALQHPSIKGLIGLDPWVEPIDQRLFQKGIQVPALFLRSEQWKKGSNNKALKEIIWNSEIKPLAYQVNNTTHYDFAMVYMYTTIIKKIGYSGKIPEKTMTNLLRETIVSFFNQTLKKNTMTNELHVPKNSYLKPIKWGDRK